MFTGAVAASYYGTPRTTMDVDIVIRLSLMEAPALYRALMKAGVCPEEKRIEAALASDYRIVSLPDTQTPYNVGLILAVEPLEKRAATLEGLPTFIQTPEALILAKLRMIKATLPPERAQKERDDIKAILSNTRVKVNYLKRRADEEETLPILEELLA